VISDGRLAGLISWDAIEDRTRFLRGAGGWSRPSWALEGLARSYRRQKWDDQPVRFEVWIEKDALTGVIAPVCSRHQVDYFSCRGYPSLTEVHNAASRHIRYQDRLNQRVVVLHLGDHDPSGIDMTRDIEDRLRMFGAKTEIRRIALNMEQVELYNPPPNPAKLSDSRSTDYIDTFGVSSWELDALTPEVIGELIEENVLAQRDNEIWEHSLQREANERAEIQDISDNYDMVVAFLDGSITDQDDWHEGDDDDDEY